MNKTIVKALAGGKLTKKEKIELGKLASEKSLKDLTAYDLKKEIMNKINCKDYRQSNMFYREDMEAVYKFIMKV